MAPYDLDREHMKNVYRLFQRFSLEDQRNYWQRTMNRYQKAAGQVNVLVAVFAFLTGFSAALAGLMVSAYLVEGSFGNSGECARLQGSRSLVSSLQDLGVIEKTEDLQSLQSLSVTREGEGVPVDNASVQAAVRDLAAIESSNCDVIQGIVNVLMVMAVVTPAIGGAFTTLASLYQWDRTVSIYEGALENLEVADSQSPMEEMDDLTYKAALRAYIENTLRVMAEETAQWGQSVRTPPQLATFVEEEKEKAARATRRANVGPMNLNEDPSGSTSEKG
ncbi:MAG: hypothetical protein K8J31_15095 [Anaerolineae bacterium]|nr:hypothetical protein [Anaerolineae bacterium]